MVQIYLDQSVYGSILDEQPADWKMTEIATVLLEAQRSEIAGVWVSPTHVIETAQTTESSRRQALAKLMLEIVQARRIWWGHEFEAIRQFLTFLKRNIPDALLFPQYVKHRLDTAGQVWLGALALLAACPDLQIDALIGDLALVKAQNQLLHARFATDQGQWISNMINAVEQREFVGNLSNPFEGMSIEKVKGETQNLISQACRLDKRSLDRLNSNRQMVARAYGAMEIGALLSTIFTNPIELSLVFDIHSIVQSWSNLQQQTNCPSLPPEIQNANLGQIAGNQEILQKVIQRVIYAATDKGLSSTTISFEVVLRDLQKCINDRSIPTGGLVFDAAHAAAIECSEIFMTTDDTLADSMRTIARAIEKQRHGEWKPAIVENAKQLKEALTRVQSR